MSQLALFAPSARSTDPETSLQAPSTEGRSSAAARIISLFESTPHRGYTDDELVERLLREFPSMDASTIKTCRLTRRNKLAAVWRLK